MNNLIKLIAIASFYLAIAFFPHSVLADTVNSTTADSAQKASQEVVKETGVKEQFGKSENGEQLLDDAKEKAGEKLNNLADKADSGKDLPDSEKLFLKNLQGK
jgi:hypothetical protein